MKKASLILIFIFTTLFSFSQNCENIPSSFPSYSKALNIVESSIFSVKENIKTAKSSWIFNASFYSCDGKTGFLVITTKKKKYLFQNVPIFIWRGFKDTDSFGTYYNQNIRNRYKVYLN